MAGSAAGTVGLKRRAGQVLWAPVALTFGIWTYFGLPREPALALTAVAWPLPLLLFWGRGRMGCSFWRCCCGFVLAKVRSRDRRNAGAAGNHRRDARDRHSRRVDRASERRAHVILVLDDIEGMTTAQLPRRLRLSFHCKDGEPAIGARIAFKARLAPLPSPVMPGGFDYGRQLWFDGIGGTGRIIAPIDVLGSRPSASALARGSA